MKRDQLHRLIEKLPEGELQTAQRFLSFLCEQPDVDPVAYTITHAPADDEPLTIEDIAALEEAHQEVRTGKLISHEDLKRELGL